MTAPARPVVGIVCCNEFAARPIQAVATRFLEPLRELAGASVLLVPADAAAVDGTAFVRLLDGLLLTGSRSNIAPHRYGAQARTDDVFDEARDEVALSLASRFIEAGKPVFGVCRGLQELNVLFGGTLSRQLDPGRHHCGSWDQEYALMFGHGHEVELSAPGRLRGVVGRARVSVNSVHECGIDRLGGGLDIEAKATDDGLVEAVFARPCGGDVLAVQWHPEWDFRSSASSRAFFTMLGNALDPARPAGPAPRYPPPPARAGGARLHGH